MTMRLLLLTALLAVPFGSAHAADDIVLADFEGPDFGAWKTEGAAFGGKPCQGMPRPGPWSGYLGKGFASSFHDDASPAPSLARCIATTGRLVSPPFRIERRHLDFLLGGGNQPGKTGIRLLVDGKEVRNATGPNGPTDKISRLDWQSWDLADLAGREAVIELFDDSTNNYISADQIVESDADYTAQHPARTLAIDKTYLLLPVKLSERYALLRLTVDGRLQRELEVRLAGNGKPDFWAFEDVSQFSGAALKVEADWLPHGATDLDSLAQSNDLPDAAGIYREAGRPQFHFSPRRGKTADPVGLVWYAGEYHLFTEHWAYGPETSCIRSWGHAVSPDLVHWKELPEALYSDALGTIFSGSAVADTGNTTGFAPAGSPDQPLVCVYASAGGQSPSSRGQLTSQSIAYSIDRGRSWTKYAGNPVVPNLIGGNRDPKVLWYQPDRRWIMALYLQNGVYALLASPDLKQWTRLSEVALPGVIEDPDFFELPVDGDARNRRWVFSANGNYAVGRFDGKAFTPEGPVRSAPWENVYADQTFDNIPPADGRRIQLAYIQRTRSSDPAFGGQMVFPRELTLRTTPDGIRLFIQPVRELETLHGKEWKWSGPGLQPGENPLSGLDGELYDLQADIALGAAAEITLTVHGLPLTYNVAERKLRFLDKAADLAPADGHLRLQLLIDRTSLEVFGNDGRINLAAGFPAGKRDGERGLSLSATGGATQAVTLQAYELKPIWP